MAQSPSFVAAQEWIANSRVTASQSTKLRLYSLFKIATSSALPPNSRPPMWDLPGRAKWDSWKSLGSESAFSGAGGQARAEEAYQVEARKLGWTGLGAQEEEVGEDEVRGVSGRHKVGEGGNEGAGMVHVSQMEHEEIDDDAPASELHDLAIEGDAQGLREFLATEEGKASEIDQADHYGFTPLQLATDRGHLEVVKVLVSAGADKSLKDEDGNTALDLAQICGHDEIAAYLTSA